MLYFNLGGSGTGKSEAMIKKIIRYTDDGKKVCIIVPDQYSFEFDKKLYRRMGAKRYNEVTVLSFSRMAKDIFAKYGGKCGEYADDLTKLSLMYRAIDFVNKNEKLNFYNIKAKSPLFINNALQVIKELRWSNINPEILAQKLILLRDNIFDKVNDISIIYTIYNKMLSENGYKDSLSDISEAAEIASINGYFKSTAVFIDEFQSFSGDELQMLDTIISSAEEINVSLTMDELPKSKSAVFSVPCNTYFTLEQIAKKYNVKTKTQIQENTYRFKAKAIEFLSKNVFRPVRNTTVNDDNVKIYEASEIYAEVDFVCTEIRKLIREEDYHFNEIAIVSRQLTDYSNVIESAFSRYEIPFFMDTKKAVMHKSLMLLVMSVFEISKRKYPDTEIVLRYAKTGLLGISYSQISSLENYCYKWNVDKELWLKDFLFDNNSPDSSINEVRKKIIEPLTEFKKKTLNVTGGIICEELYKLFIKIELDKNISGIASSVIENETRALQIAREQKQLWNTLIEILEAIHNTLGETLISVSDFYELLRIMLSESSFATPPQTLDCIIVSSAERARFAAPKVVFVIGVNEGIFPYAVKNTGLFSDRDKSILEQAGLRLSINTKHKIDEERFVAYTALSAPSEKLYITYPLSDATGKVRFPSYLIEQIIKMFESKITAKISELPSVYFCTTEKSAYYNYVQSYNRKDESSASLRAYLLGNESYREKIKYLDRVNFDNNQQIADKEVTKQIFGEKLLLSASRFEDFSKCPFSYFCKKGLGIYPLQRIEINAMEQGNVIHKCMYEIFKAYDKEHFVTETPENLIKKINVILDNYYNDVLGGDFGKTARFKALYKNISGTILEVLIHLQKEFSQSEFVPTDFELKISEAGPVTPMKLVSKKGTEILFVGTIDRVDTFRDGEKTYVRVVDYKSGSKAFRLEDILYGVNMQMLLYLFTLTQNEARYKSPIPAGVLYMPSKELEADLSRDSGSNELVKAKEKGFKMNGILLNDEKILKAMEKDVAGIYVPVKKSKDGFSKASSLITKKQLENLQKYSEKLLIEMADSLYSGKINASPLSDGKSSPCDYCEYWSVCGNDSVKSREYKENAKEIIQGILDGGEENAE